MGCSDKASPPIGVLVKLVLLLVVLVKLILLLDALVKLVLLLVFW